MGRLLVYPRSELESTELTERTYKAVHLLKLLLFRAFMDADVRFAFEEIKNNTATPSFDMLMAAELDELFVVTGSAAAARASNIHVHHVHAAAPTFSTIWEGLSLQVSFKVLQHLLKHSVTKQCYMFSKKYPTIPPKAFKSVSFQVLLYFV